MSLAVKPIVCTPTTFDVAATVCDWLAPGDTRLHSLPLDLLVTRAFDYLTSVREPALDPYRVAEALANDWAPRRLPPRALRPFLSGTR